MWAHRWMREAFSEIFIICKSNIPGPRPINLARLILHQNGNSLIASSQLSKLTCQSVFRKSPAAFHPGEGKVSRASHVWYRWYRRYARCNTGWVGRGWWVWGWRHGSVSRDTDDTASVRWIDVNVHIHADIHVHVHVVGARQPSCHGAGRIVYTVVPIGINVRRQLVIRVAGSIRKHAAAGLIRAVQNLIYSKADGLVLLVGLVHFFNACVLHSCI